MANEKRLIPLQKRIIYAGDVFNSLMAEKKWSATEAAEFVKEFRVVESVEVVHGRWELYPSSMHRRCSVCKMEYDRPKFNVRANYCPNCGADMR